MPTASWTGVEAHTIPRLMLVVGEAAQGRWTEGTEIAVDLRGAPWARTAEGKWRELVIAALDDRLIALIDALDNIVLGDWVAKICIVWDPIESR